MDVKELKKHLEPMRDNDLVVVEFPDLGTGGFDETEDVGVGVVVENDVLTGRKAKVIITALS